jgi:hypothetical protein
MASGAMLSGTFVPFCVDDATDTICYYSGGGYVASPYKTKYMVATALYNPSTGSSVVFTAYEVETPSQSAMPFIGLRIIGFSNGEFDSSCVVDFGTGEGTPALTVVEDNGAVYVYIACSQPLVNDKGGVQSGVVVRRAIFNPNATSKLTIDTSYHTYIFYTTAPSDLRKVSVSLGAWITNTAKWLVVGWQYDNSAAAMYTAPVGATTWTAQTIPAGWNVGPSPFYLMEKQYVLFDEQRLEASFAHDGKLYIGYLRLDTNGVATFSTLSMYSNLGSAISLRLGNVPTLYNRVRSGVRYLMACWITSDGKIASTIMPPASK